ncbi:polyphosphoinositide phosphatase-like isoform X2 [Haliotis rufescens]|uniref:polyphosphoinositide phosphatase-like isoform X2 n=1 Tax=Haliotis rufescens TaxID=6454 RepID=UPI00201F55D2|nr:polyphosphoinositide phosphatase-like isoform X2 [Haliotis rufescens]
MRKTNSYVPCIYGNVLGYGKFTSYVVLCRIKMERPVISYLQKLVLYETKARFYIVGSNKTETKFRVLKIDRTEPRELVVHDDKVEYSKTEIRNILTMINVGNQTPLARRGGVGLTKTVSAFGIVGFIRFLEGYYVILVTKRRKVALIGPHTIYKIEDTSMLYIPNDTVRFFHPEESRYVRMFQNVDLSSNFYFSYSYDLTHTLQYNMTPSLEPGHQPHFDSMPSPVAGNQEFLEDIVARVRSPRPPGMSTPGEDGGLLRDMNSIPRTTQLNQSMDGSPRPGGETVYGVRNKPCEKFVWNKHLLKGVMEVVHPDWIIYFTNGFVGQSNVNVYGKPIYLTLIGRRSNQYAGTRFLKRGANSEGAVANEIETEQIVHDASVTFLEHGKVTSFTQMRGSIPLFWSQDIAKMVPKPPIMLDKRDPYAHSAGLHFNQVLLRNGAPVIVLNLVKMREKKRHESILSDEFIDTINYLNQFLPPEHTIQYIGFDMARVNKRKDTDVLVRLAKIAKYCIKQTGFFLSMPPAQAQVVLKDEEFKGIQGHRTATGLRQTGIVRTNCVDCLDRTNTAQFAVGRCAMAYQLYALNVIDKPHLEFDTDCLRMLEDLYEDHGDTMALQYGGSQLVHRIKGYRKISPWTSHSRDIMQTLSRYYSNAFSDLEKQQAYNLFLGVFAPKDGDLNLWELPTDYYLHNRNALTFTRLKHRSYSQWWDLPVCRSLPLSSEEESKSLTTELLPVSKGEKDERVNAFFEYYRPFELTSLDDHYCMSMTSSIKDFMPKGASDPSPFHLRRIAATAANPAQQDKSGQEANPNISGKDSTSSVTSQGSEGSTSSTDDSDMEGDVNLGSDSSSPYDSESESNYVSFQDLFPSMKKVYNTDITDLNKRDKKLYERYVEIQQGYREPETSDPSRSTNGVKQSRVKPGLDVYPISAFKLDSTYGVEPPPVSRLSQDIYAAYVLRGLHGAGPPTKADKITYAKYVSHKYM